MRKILYSIFILLLAASYSHAQIFGGGTSTGVKTDSNCNQAQYYPIGTLCQDTDDGKLYKGTGAAVEEITAGTGISADGSVAWTGAPIPNAANTIAIGSTSAEWADLYLGDGAIIYGQNDQSNTLTSAATGWSANLLFTANAGLAVKNGATGAGFIDIYEDSDDGTNKIRLQSQAMAGDLTYILPSAAIARGSILKGSSTANTLDWLAIGTTGKILTTDGTDPSWSAYTVAAPGAAGAVLYSDGTNWTRAATLSITLDNAAAQFADKDTATKKMKIDPSGMTATKTATIAGVCTDDCTITLPSATATLATVGGALGTPSFTALNMPSSNADPGTTAGQIRHDNSNTSSSANGLVAWYDGTNVRQLVDTGAAYTKITKAEYIPIRYAEDDDSVTAPAAAAEIGTTGLIARSFAEDADNGVLFFWQVPFDFVSGIKYRVYYAVDTNASADETVAFGLSGCSIGNSDAIACTEGTAVNVTDELTTDEDTGELIVTGWSTEVTVTDIAAGEIAKLLFIRDVSEDDTAGHTLVVGIEIKYVGRLNPFSDY